MKWSRLKKRIEDTFADSVRGRVAVWSTRYRRSHDQEGEAWITIDKERAYSMGTYTYFKSSYEKAERLRAERECTNFRDPDQKQDYYRAGNEAHTKAHDEGAFALWDVDEALFAYLNMSIDAILSSKNPIIRGFGMLDRRLGKRRIVELDSIGEHPLVGLLYEFRRTAEGIGPNRRESSDADQPQTPPACKPGG